MEPREPPIIRKKIERIGHSISLAKEKARKRKRYSDGESEESSNSESDDSYDEVIGKSFCSIHF